MIHCNIILIDVNREFFPRWNVEERETRVDSVPRRKWISSLDIHKTPPLCSFDEFYPRAPCVLLFAARLIFQVRGGRVPSPTRWFLAPFIFAECRLTTTQTQRASYIEGRAIVSLKMHPPTDATRSMNILSSRLAIPHPLRRSTSLTCGLYTHVHVDRCRNTWDASRGDVRNSMRSQCGDLHSSGGIVYAIHGDGNSKSELFRCYLQF